MNATSEAMWANFNAYKNGQTMKDLKAKKATAKVDRMDLVLRMAEIEGRISQITEVA